MNEWWRNTFIDTFTIYHYQGIWRMRSGLVKGMLENNQTLSRFNDYLVRNSDFQSISSSAEFLVFPENASLGNMLMRDGVHIIHETIFYAST